MAVVLLGISKEVRENRMKLFKCNHNWAIEAKSNALQVDAMGYPLRLFLVKCSKCGQTEHHWYDVPIREAEEIKTGESVLVMWQSKERN